MYLVGEVDVQANQVDEVVMNWEQAGNSIGTLVWWKSKHPALINPIRVEVRSVGSNGVEIMAAGWCHYEIVSPESLHFRRSEFADADDPRSTR